MQNMIWYLLWAIGPLVPAIALYRALPRVKTDASVKGKLHELQFKIGGAGALFFIIFFVMNPVKLGLINKDSLQSRWELVTSFQNNQNDTIPPDQLRSIEPIPNVAFQALDNHRIMVNIPAVDIDREKRVTMPFRLRFTFADYEPQRISSSEFFNNSNHCKINWKDKEICLKNLPKLVAKPRKPADSSQTEMANETIIN